MNYTGQHCPGCGKTMGEDDDIVVCPVCGTPQHRICWEQNGNCVNAARHSTGFSWQPDKTATHEHEHREPPHSAEQGTQRCSVCGAENPGSALSCLSCGAPISGTAGAGPVPPFFNMGNMGVNPFLYGVALDPESDIDGMKVKELASFVQSGAHKYIPKFKASSGGKKKITFNWAAFFLSPYWFFFRKLWGVGLIFMGLMLAVSLFFTQGMQDFSDTYYALANLLQSGASQADISALVNTLYSQSLALLPMFALNIVLHLVAGFCADPIYKRRVYSDLRKIKAGNPDERSFAAATLRRGGSSIFIAFISYFGYTVIYNMLLSLATFLIS